jgi:5'-nucleotidase
MVKVIAFNDFHGNLQSPGTFGVDNGVPPSERPPVGGAEFLAAHVARLKAANPLNVVVGAGDMVGATPLISGLLRDEPSVDVLNQLGLEFTAVGNHEFDHGAAELLRLQRLAQFQWLSANVFDAHTGRTLLPAYGVKRFNDVDVAFIGMTLEATPSIVMPSGVAGLAFRAEAATANALVPELRAKGIEAIVVLIHQGGFQSGTRSAINACEGNLAGSPIAKIVAQLDDAIDLVVAGHAHVPYNCRLLNSAGRHIPVTSASAFGRVVTDLDVTLDPTSRDVVAVKAVNRLVARNDPSIPADAAMAALVARYDERSAPIANRVIGSIAGAVSNARVDPACEMPAGELVADAMLEATRGEGATVAFTHPGGVRAPGLVGSQVTYRDAFTLQPFGNSVVTLTLGAQELKDALEEQFAGCRGQPAATTRVMLPSAGFKFTWDGARACDARIRTATLTTAKGTEKIVEDGAIVGDPARAFRVTVNSYMAEGGDGFSTFARAARQSGGPQDIDAFVAYMARFNAPDPPYRRGARPEDGGTPRIHRIGGKSCPTAGETNP